MKNSYRLNGERWIVNTHLFFNNLAKRTSIWRETRKNKNAQQFEMKLKKDGEKSEKTKWYPRAIQSCQLFQSSEWLRKFEEKADKKQINNCMRKDRKVCEYFATATCWVLRKNVIHHWKELLNPLILEIVKEWMKIEENRVKRKCSRENETCRRSSPPFTKNGYSRSLFPCINQVNNHLLPPMTSHTRITIRFGLRMLRIIRRVKSKFLMWTWYSGYWRE